MRIALFTASALAALAVAAPAQAQDEESSFTGPRVEGVVGWDRVDDGGATGVDASDGVLYGGAVGYDFDLGNAVVGVEGEATFSSIEESADAVIAAGDSLSVKAGRDLYIGGRVGFKVGERALIYAKGGYTNGKIDTLYTTPTTQVETDEEIDGWRAGAGAEVKLNGKVYIKGEYRYSNYSALSGFPVDLDRHQVVGGVGIRF